MKLWVNHKSLSECPLLKAASSQEKKELEQSFLKISQLEQQLAQKGESFTKQQANLQATQAKIADLELKSEKGVDYTQLRDLLAAGEWKEADQETDKVMLEAASREGQGWLSVEDIDNFPCENLRTINQLWLHYSNGKFGFSVQKEIYESLGGTREYNEKVWNSFGDRVGWRKGGNWVNYDELTFKKNAPQAHLPTGVRAIGKDGDEELDRDRKNDECRVFTNVQKFKNVKEKDKGREKSFSSFSSLLSRKDL